MSTPKTSGARGADRHRLFHAVVLSGLSLAGAGACGGSSQEKPAAASPPHDAADESPSNEASPGADASPASPADSGDDTSGTANPGSPDAPEEGADSAELEATAVQQDGTAVDASVTDDACLPPPPYRCNCAHPCILLQ